MAGGLPIGKATAKERGCGNCFVPPSNEAMKDSDAVRATKAKQERHCWDREKKAKKLSLSAAPSQLERQDALLPRDHWRRA